MALTKKSKILLLFAPFAFLLLVSGVLGIRYWWYKGYSKGSRSGIVRKVSVKGPPYCKYLSGELITAEGVSLGVPAPMWEFSVDDTSDDNPIVKQLHEAEKSGKRVTLHYRQDLHSLYRCTPSEYFITKVEK
jgi:hypothetical protein